MKGKVIIIDYLEDRKEIFLSVNDSSILYIILYICIIYYYNYYSSCKLNIFGYPTSFDTSAITLNFVQELLQESNIQ